MSVGSFAANTLWWLACAPGAMRFGWATRHAERAQRAVLVRILSDAADTAYGREHNFAAVSSPEDYQARVPITDYEDYLPYIHRIGQGESDVLARGAPICFEPTSGSSSAGKLIPYTPALRAEYQGGISAWVFDMFRRHPRLLSGRAYWSISPATLQAGEAAGCVPVGFDDDTAYLNPVAQRLIRSTLAVPAEVAKLGDMATFRYVTLAFLLAARDLTLISVWNPTFLSLMLASLDGWAASLIDDIAHGTLSPPGDAPSALMKQLVSSFRPNPARAREVEAALSCGHDGKTRFDLIWPRLGLISCWNSAAAAGPARQLQELFPRVRIAPKGLLATEGIVSIPYGRGGGHALSLLSHFLEFAPEGECDVCLPSWRLDEGGRYSVVLTTGGGLYRYRLRDIVRVTGFLHQCPLVEFLGKESIVSDHYGEKLNEQHVAAILESIGVRCSFAMLAPDGDAEVDHYTLFLADESQLAAGELDRLARGLESELCKNVHYAYCRKLGQLREAAVCWIDSGPQSAWARYFDECRRRGQREGDIKPRTLDTKPGWRLALCAAEFRV